MVLKRFIVFNLFVFLLITSQASQVFAQTPPAVKSPSIVSYDQLNLELKTFITDATTNGPVTLSTTLINVFLKITNDSPYLIDTLLIGVKQLGISNLMVRGGNQAMPIVSFPVINGVKTATATTTPFGTNYVQIGSRIPCNLGSFPLSLNDTIVTNVSLILTAINNQTGQSFIVTPVNVNNFVYTPSSNLQSL
jgi:hypothetical protein